MKKLKQQKSILIYAIALIAFFISNVSYSQTPTAGDCLGATPVCQDVYYEPNIFSGTGSYPNEIPNCSPTFCTTCCPNNCLDGEWNSAWYIFTVQTSGLLSFTIQPDVASDDYDWAVYNMTDNRCEELYTMVNTLQRSCNAAGISNTTGMSSANGGSSNCNVCGTTGTNKWNADLIVTQGETYVLYVSNWGGGAQGGFTLDFSASTAVIFDNVPPYIASVEADDVSGCNETDITILFSENVTCSGIAPSLFTIEGPGGPYQVTEVYGPACEVGGDWEKEFTLTVDHPFSSNGMYTLYMDLGFPGIQDVCNNIAPADTMSFFLDLGAPVVDESGLQIGEATCGMDNGSITGLVVTGQTTLSYVWKNSQGAIVGDLPDLIDIPAETYTLEVYDLIECISYAGPYVVSELGAPEIDDANIVIIPSNYGAGNGSISGIVVNTSNTISEYIWKDEIGNIVGNNLDLTDVSTGYYNLTVIDDNTCEAFSGPYFVGEIGGPLTANPSANPLVICDGDAATLSPGAGGGSGTYEYSWTSTPAGFTSTLENPMVTPDVTTTYHLELNDGYILANGDVTVTVHSLPLPDAGEDQTISNGIYTFLDGSASSGSGDYLYFWTPVDKLEDATVANPQTKNLYETTPFHLSVEDAQTGCVAIEPDEVIVEVAGGILSVNPSSFPDSVFCIGEDFWLHANAGGGSGEYTYTWTSDPVMTLPSAPSFSMTLFDPGTYFFYVLINDGYNEVYSYVEVTVDPAPVIDLGPPIQLFCLYDTVELDAGNAGSEYLWSNGATTQSITIGTTGLGYDPQEYSVNVINQVGCEADTTVTIIFDYDACVGINEHLSEANVKVFPNPTTGGIVVEMIDIDGSMNMSVFNILGEIKMHEKLPPAYDGSIREEFDLSSFPRGIYMLKFYNNNSMKILEIILK